MFYKLSNIATRETMEQEVSAVFKFPNIYKPNMVIDGTQESIVPIITSEAKANIQFAIWGLLPDHFQDDWQPYQKQHNTLNVQVSDITQESDLKSAKRCLIPVTGYFGFYNVQGEIRSYYNVNASEKPFCIAGIYNQLDDGFLTCSIIITKKQKKITSAGGINNLQPAILAPSQHDAWLNTQSAWATALACLEQPHSYTINRYPTSNRLSINNKVSNLCKVLGLDDAV